MCGAYWSRFKKCVCVCTFVHTHRFLTFRSRIRITLLTKYILHTRRNLTYAFNSEFSSEHTHTHTRSSEHTHTKSSEHTHTEQWAALVVAPGDNHHSSADPLSWGSPSPK